MSTYYKECFLEQIYHYNALDIWDKIKIGEKVSIIMTENDYKHSKQVKVKFNDAPQILGVLSEEDSESMLPFFQNGRDDIFYGEICFIDNIDSENKRIKIVVRILKKK